MTKLIPIALLVLFNGRVFASCYETKNGIVDKSIAKIADFSSCTNDELIEINSSLTNSLAVDVKLVGMGTPTQNTLRASNLTSRRAALALVRVEILARQMSALPKN